ncbi:ATP-binding protein [Reinekea blandensis]|uniref:histidine kinase n=1 Tax=Reinekea blandensis MED297 TaxID=314283 RepID=A4BKN8_9GAMM|nr:ATP-binding protein [Reinekea blandensis]EAR07317.1 GGDEF family protein [Reinekea sp. MED297] [Reinekea blandensis MED297]
MYRCHSIPKRLFFLAQTTLLLVCLSLTSSFTIAEVKESFWLNDQFADMSLGDLSERNTTSLEPRENLLSVTGGTFWHFISVDLTEMPPQVIDFESSSVVGRFTHYIFDSQQTLVDQLSGGIQSSEPNPYFLRHGRNLNLPPGEYRIYTRVDSPFLLAQPTPKLYEQTAYVQSIKTGNTITLLGLGVFLALGIYYTVLGLTRRQPEDFLYALFILGNLVYNSTSLNVFSDVFGWTSFYSIGFPIMASNMAYIGFVWRLLGINRYRTPVLFRISQGALIVMGSFWLIVPFMPEMSLEFARYGVGMFALYGISSGIVMALKGHHIARYYLIANVAFIIPALISIGLNSLPNSTLMIEHIGLFAVAIEVILLSLVISYQLSLVYKEKSANLIAAEEALTIADNAVRAKERFLANVSHELRTPLNAIQGSVDLLSHSSQDESLKEPIDMIQHSSSFLLFLINDILDLAKLNADMLTIDEQPFNLHGSIQQICSIYSNSLANNAQTRFELTISPDVPTWIVGDEKRLEQVIANLLSNAFKFTEKGKVTCRLTLKDTHTLMISVQDTGIGIKPDNLDAMFAAFTQADSSISRKYGGTGLGLRISSKIIEQMGGEIWAESETGQGSTFTFTLPLVLAEAQPENNHASDAPLKTSIDDMVVMVVDDNPVNLKVIEGMLKTIGARVVCFGQAKEAIKYVSSHAIDLIIMDVQMPEIDGLQATQSLRRSGFKQPVIAYTANASEEDHQACVTAGMNDVLVKPIRLNNLVDVLNRWGAESKSQSC